MTGSEPGLRVSPASVRTMRCYPTRDGLAPQMVAAGWVVVCCLGAGSFVIAQESAGSRSAAENPIPFVALEIEPAEVLLHAANRQQQLLVTARCADGKFVDLTRQAQFSLSEPGIARVAGDAIVGLRDGATELT